MGCCTLPSHLAPHSPVLLAHPGDLPPGEGISLLVDAGPQPQHATTKLTCIMTDPAHVVLGIARIEAEAGGRFLGTAFGVATNLVATCLHNIGGSDRNLRLLAIDGGSINGYQDTTETSFESMPIRVKASDSLRDICLLELTDPQASVGSFPKIASPDSLNVGELVFTFGFPHSTNAGRVVLTRQDSIVGAKVLLNSQGVKTKHVVVNLQARPGQSGGPVYSPRLQAVVGMIMGSFAPATQGGILLGNIDPQTLPHQTTHAISAEYLQRMVTSV